MRRDGSEIEIATQKKQKIKPQLNKKKTMNERPQRRGLKNKPEIIKTNQTNKKTLKKNRTTKK